MAQDTILEMLHRPRSLPPITEEEQALMNAMAEREQAETRARRTAERPGVSDTAWRAAYGVADVVDPAVGSLADLVTGATVGADPSARTQPIWEQRPSMQEVGELAATVSPLKAIAPFAIGVRRLFGKRPLSQLGRMADMRRPVHIPDDPYSTAKEYADELFPVELHVELNFGDFVSEDSIKGLNVGHALQRAAGNWPSAKNIKVLGAGRRGEGVFIGRESANFEDLPHVKESLKLLKESQ
jgi:hypothetical protein